MGVFAALLIRPWLPVTVACLSLGLGVCGVVELLGDDWLLLDIGFLPEQVAAGVVAVLGFLGVPAAVGHVRTEWSPAAYRPLLWFTGVQVAAAALLVAQGAAPSTRVFAFVLGAGWMLLGVRGLRYSRLT